MIIPLLRIWYLNVNFQMHKRCMFCTLCNLIIFYRFVYSITSRFISCIIKFIFLKEKHYQTYILNELKSNFLPILISYNVPEEYLYCVLFYMKMTVKLKNYSSVNYIFSPRHLWGLEFTWMRWITIILFN